MRHDDEYGEGVLRLRRTPGRDGCDVLVRLSILPLSARRWRAEGYHAAVNATVAAAMIRLSEPHVNDRVANLMCGSGTILVERLPAGRVRSAVGIDVLPETISAAEAKGAKGASPENSAVVQAMRRKSPRIRPADPRYSQRVTPLP
jgi:tRNA (guanine6-N2)-methyltransferase